MWFLLLGDMHAYRYPVELIHIVGDGTEASSVLWEHRGA